MTRVLSALVLIPLVVGTVWFLPFQATLLLALVAAVLAFAEYVAIAETLGARVPRGIGSVAVALTCIAVAATAFPRDVFFDVRGQLTPWSPPSVLDVLFMSLLIVVGTLAVATGRPAPGILADAAATVFAAVYIGLPLGALAAVRADLNGGREAVLLLMAVIVVSDSAQFYTGRALGRRPLAPMISPKKTVEGAIGGTVFGTAAMIVVGRWVFANASLPILALLGATIAALGIVGDLFESLLKRSAGVKDSSQLIPGHGGVLDRIDSWLFAAPVYYVFVKYLS
jgi:phosphatidate cytidylyltransferase